MYLKFQAVFFDALNLYSLFFEDYYSFQFRVHYIVHSRIIQVFVRQKKKINMFSKALSLTFASLFIN